MPPIHSPTQSCFDCERLGKNSMQSTRPHPYLVFARKVMTANAEDSQAQEFMCVLCKARFLFPADSSDQAGDRRGTHESHSYQPSPSGEQPTG
jgi:hypothetical protein